MDKISIRLPRIPKIFRQFSFKQSRTWGAILAISGRQPIWTKKDFANLSREGFQKCMTAYSCISLIAQSCAGIPWQLFSTPRTPREKTQEIKKHDLINLLRRPNPYEGQSAFIERAVSFFKLAGNSYIERVGPNPGKPRELYALRPDRVKVDPGDSLGLVKGYIYSAGGKNETFYDGEILHLKSFHPLDDWYGLSPIEVAARGIDISNMALAWNYKLLQNDARPSGALVTEKGLDDEQRANLKADIKTEYGGYENAGRPLLLEAGMKWEQMSLNPTEMDWLNLDKVTLRKICTVFNIAPELMGDTEQKKFSNYQEARKALYMEVILPHMDYFRDEFNNWLTPKFGDNLRLDYNRDAIKALQEEATKTFDRMSKAHWLTVDEKRIATGYEEDPSGNGGVILVPINFVPIETISEGREGGTKAEDKLSFWQNKARKKLLWRHFMMRVEMKERILYNPIKTYLKNQAQKVKKALSQARDMSSIDINAIFNVDKNAGKYARKFMNYYEDAVQKAGEAGIQASQGKLMDLDVEEKVDPDIEDIFSITPALRKILEEMILESGTKIAKTTLTKIERMMEKALKENWTAEEFTQNIFERLDGLALSRSRKIANTEMGKVENWGQLEGYKQSELVERKGWLSAFLPTTRDTHAEADAYYSDNPIPLDQAFEVGGELLQYPGDPSGSPENVIECKCATYPEVKELAE